MAVRVPPSARCRGSHPFPSWRRLMSIYEVDEHLPGLDSERRLVTLVCQLLSVRRLALRQASTRGQPPDGNHLRLSSRKRAATSSASRAKSDAFVRS